MPLDIVQSAVFMAFAAASVSDRSYEAWQLNEAFEVLLEGPSAGGYAGFFPTFNQPGRRQLIGGDWSVVWGPFANLAPDNDGRGPAANSMYVAHSPSQRTTVVAVAGTAKGSLYDWLDEDVDVTWLHTVRWSTLTGKPGDGLISGGTNHGLSDLLHMQPTGESTLPAFLRGLDGTGNTLVFTGHSLGGALSPALALLLHDELKGKGWTAIRVLPLAGPTPGDHAFAKLFNDAFEPEPEPTRPGFFWNRDQRNVHDLVPRAWNDLRSALPRGGTATSGGDPSLPPIWRYVTWEVSLCLHALIGGLSALALGVSYTPLNPMQIDPPFGSFERDPPDPHSPGWTSLPTYTAEDPIRTVKDANALILPAHYDQYLKYFDLIPIPRPPRTEVQREAARAAQLATPARLAAARPSEGSVPPPPPDAG